MGAIRTLAVSVSLAAGAYALAVRPRLLRWGATDEEVRRPYPGADLIPDGTRSATMAVTIDAPPARVWPWLVQMGYGRAGWYSWDHLDNWGHASAEEIHPEWQDIHQGDFLGPREGITSRAWAVAALEPERFLGLRASFDLQSGRWFDPRGPRPRSFTDSLWGFLLEEQPGGRTRLVVSGYWALRPRWLQPVMSVLFLEPSHWIMQTRQFTKLKWLAEGEAPHQTPAVPSGSTEAASAVPRHSAAEQVSVAAQASDLSRAWESSRCTGVRRFVARLHVCRVRARTLAPCGRGNRRRSDESRSAPPHHVHAAEEPRHTPRWSTYRPPKGPARLRCRLLRAVRRD